VKDPVSRRLVLPWARLQQVADDGCCTGTTHALDCFEGSRETEHSAATGHEDLDDLGADEPRRAGDKRDCVRVDCHGQQSGLQAKWRPPTAPAQHSYAARTGA
jgi:hypothetical protein